jgi:FlaA1/EpsC-like NDP-sugar epimerase
VIGDGGETFVLDMGEPVKIDYLARQMILLSGREPGRDIRIEYTGLRPGEKLYEELFYPSEELAETRHPKIQIARSGGSRLSPSDLSDALNRLRSALAASDESRMLDLIGALLPDWRPAGGLPEPQPVQLVRGIANQL